MGKKQKKKQKKRSELLGKICSGKDGKKINPFELKINKEKHQILGRKQKKLIGLPTVTHKKALQKRKDTLLQEYVYRNKKNTFFDKRLHIEKRKAMQVMHQRPFENEEHLCDDEELTHRGQSLSQIEKMEDPISDSDDEQLHAGFVENAHFGGFLTEKKSKEPVKSRKELIKEIIAESKRRKYEKQSEKEAGIEMTEKLDSEWKQIQGLMFKSSQTKKEEETKNVTSYDMMVHELKFELRGGVSMVTKRPEDTAKEEREKQIKLEMDRKGRMNMCFSDEPENILSQKSVESINMSPATKSKMCDDMNKDNDKITPLAISICSTEMLQEKKLQYEIKINPSCEEKEDYRIPTTLQEFMDRTSECSKEQLSLLIDKIITTNRSQGNNLGIFFNTLLEYICYVADNEDSDIMLLDILIPRLYELALMSTTVAANYLLHMLKTSEQHFEDVQKATKKKQLHYPKLSTLLILKVCCILFPASDFRHFITSPALLFMTRLLSECQVLSISDMLCGLFTCNLALECVSYSKRYIPEAIGYLSGLLNLAICKDNKNITAQCSPFGDCNIDLNLSEISVETTRKFKLSDLRNNSKEVDNALKLQLLNCCVELLLKFIDLYKELPSYMEIFSSVSNICKNLITLNCPEFLSNKISKIIMSTKPTQVKKYLVQPKRPLKCLRFIEPKIEENFDGQKVRKGNKQHLEKEKLKHKYKRELKGAVREIRHDNYFLASHWLDEQVSRDKERKEKVKRLYQELASQEGDIKALKRKKF